MSEKSADREVVVKLALSEVLERAEAMARRVAEVQRLRVKKAADAKGTQALIDSALDEIERLGRVITAQEELRKQGDLFVGDEVVPSTAESTQALALIAEQGALMDATDENLVPVIEAAPEKCPVCDYGVQLFDSGTRVMCGDNHCTWVAKIVPAVPEPTEEQRAAAMQWVAENGGGEQLIEAAALYWERFAPRSTFDAAMVGWCANTGAPLLAATLHRESIERARDNIGFPAEAAIAKTEQQPDPEHVEFLRRSLGATEPTAVCDHAKVQGRKKPRAGKHLLCPDCNEVLHNCEACKRYETPDDLGPCDWDHCGTAVCVDCQVKHEESAAPNDSAASDESDDARPCAACGLVETDNSVCLACRAYLCDGCRDKHNCEESSAQASA